MKQQTFGKPPISDRQVKVKQTSYGLKYHSLSTNEKTPEAIIRDAENIHDKHNFYMLYSGGRDSGLVAEWLAENNKLKAIVHVKTNIGMKMCEDFIEKQCKEKNWDLIILEPKPKYAYVDLVMEYGFPAPSLHRVFMARLKYHTMHRFIYHLNDKHAALVSGIRQMESKRRQKSFTTPIQNDSKLWFINPFFYYTNEDMYKMRLTKNIKTSPSYDHGLNVSGDCLCGSFANYSVKDTLRKADPHLAGYIAWLEDGIQKYGSKQAKKYSKWAGTTRMSEMEKQTQLDQVLETFPSLKAVNNAESQFCGSDCGPGTMKGETDF